jgi:hypothetical protein
VWRGRYLKHYHATFGFLQLVNLNE